MPEKLEPVFSIIPIFMRFQQNLLILENRSYSSHHDIKRRITEGDVLDQDVEAKSLRDKA